MRSAIILLLAALSACSDRSPPEPAPQHIRPAKLMTVAGGHQNTLYEFIARVEALQSVDLSFEVGGPLAELPVLEGEFIKKGALIASLDPTEFRLSVREAEVQRRLAEQDLERKRKLLGQKVIAKSLVEDAENHYELQHLRLSQTRERLADTRLLAPFDGYLAKRYFDSFVNVEPGEAVVRLHDLAQLRVVMSIPESLVATVRPSELVQSRVEFDFAPGRMFDISYHENHGEADALGQTYEVSFIMENPGDSLRILPGMTATARLQVRTTGPDVILLPLSALVPTANGELSVWVYDAASSRVHRRLLAVGAPTKQGVPVTSGLSDGEQVVIVGASQVRDGMLVRPFR